MPVDTQDPKTTILIVDDDPDICALVRAQLERDGQTVVVAGSGREGLEVASRTVPDLVITDVLMPEFDGWSLVRSLRSRPATALIPVIFLTALNGSEDRLRGFRLGADDFLSKPFAGEELGLRVERVLRARSDLGREAAAIAQPHLEGQLERIGMSALLVMLEAERKTGTLTLTRDEARCAITLRDGQVIGAELINRDDQPLRGCEAVFGAFGWMRGEFVFREELITDDGEGMSTTYLLLEAARRVDELSRDGDVQLC